MMILVTGGTGLVGAHLLLHLVDNENQIRALYRQPSTINKTKTLFAVHQKEALFPKIEWIQADITNVPSLEIAFKNVDYVYHCAGLISFDPNDEDKLRKTNIEGTANIINFCLDHKVKKLCHVSSIAALGDVVSKEISINEEAEWNPEAYHSDYAISKYGAEMEVWRGQQEGLNVVIINPGVILGSTLWKKGSGALFAKVKKGPKGYTLGQTGYVGVNDVVQIMIKLMKSDIVGERFCLISENMSYQKILNCIALNFNTNIPRFYVKPWMTSIFWRIDWFFNTFFKTKRILSKHSAIAIHTISHYDNSKIKKTLKFDFQSIDNVIKNICLFDKS